MSMPEGDLEFRSSADDAWYNALVRFHGEKLTVKYVGFDENHNEVFDASMFESLEELEKFEGRFRPLSVQIQDHECFKAVEGLVVCASHASGDANLFYDAVVENVLPQRHSFENGVEECLCSFILTWKHGPFVEMEMDKKVENICLIQSNEKPHQNVALFLEIAKDKIDKKCAKQSGSQVNPSEVVGMRDDIKRMDKEDLSFGGDNSMILLENLEKDLSPSTITEFIYQQTSIVSSAYVFPSSSAESYARGAIVSKTYKDLRVLCKFLNDPNHIIISSRGKPWVVGKVVENTLNRCIEAPSETSILQFQDGNTRISYALKLAYSGTEEFEKAKALRELHMEFILHQKRLHGRLALEEKKILKQSPTAL